MALDPSFIDSLVCPESMSRLRRAPDQLVDRINTAIGDGLVRNRAGNLVTEPIREALVREDSVLVYLVREEIPNLLIDESLELDKVP